MTIFEKRIENLQKLLEKSNNPVEKAIIADKIAKIRKEISESKIITEPKKVSVIIDAPVVADKTEPRGEQQRRGIVINNEFTSVQI